MDIDAAARRSTDLELAVEAVQHTKAHLVALDRRQNLAREGVRALKTAAGGSTATGPVWVLCPGGVFVRAPTAAAALQHLEQDLAALSRKVDAERLVLRAHVVALAQLEGPDSALAQLNKGFHLQGV